MTPAFDCVITGAGISVPAPSVLPSGDDLAAVAWRLLFQAPEEDQLRRICAEVEPDLRTPSGLRLEYLLEILGQSVHLSALTAVYRVMADAVPNLNHYAVAAMHAHRHFTLNMDTLLEQARHELDRQGLVRGSGPSDGAVHLHGRWDEPSSIATTISQYLKQLPAQLGEDFVSAVQGKDVLVMGYSGRDIDVFPTIVTHPPRRLRWIRHPGVPLEPEVEAHLEHLARTTSTRLEIESRAASDELMDLLDARAVRAVRGLVARGLGTPRLETGVVRPHAFLGWAQRLVETSSVDGLAQTPLSQRALGAARVLFELGAFNQLERLVELQPCEGGDAMMLRKVQARSFRRSGRNLRAACALLRPVKQVGAAGTWAANANEIANLVTRMGVPAVGTAMDRALISVTSNRTSERAQRVNRQVQIRVAQNQTYRGALARGRAILEDVISDDLATLIGLSGRIDAITWLVDAVKLQGDLDVALELVDELKSGAPYSNLSQRAYAYWQIGSVYLLAGRDADMVAPLELADAMAQRSGDIRAAAWVAGTYSNALRVTDQPAARRVLTSERPRRSTHYLARQFLLLQMAEQARAEGDLLDAEAEARSAWRIRRPSTRSRRRDCISFLAGRSIAVCIAAERSLRSGDVRWLDRAECLRGAYLARGAVGAANDLAVLLHVVGGQPLLADLRTLSDVQRANLAEPWDWRRTWRITA